MSTTPLRDLGQVLGRRPGDRFGEIEFAGSWRWQK